MTIQGSGNKGCLWAVVAVVAVPAILVMMTMFTLVVWAWHSHLAIRSVEESGVDESPQLAAVWSFGKGEAQVVRIPIQGEIGHNVSSGFFASMDPVENILRQIRAAAGDPQIRGIILEIDSPGGEVTACDEIYHELMLFKQAEHGRVVVAIFGDLAASGGYYIACAADRIIAQPTTITGSIGVLISAMNFRGLGEKLGVRDVTIKSGDNKDIFNPLQDMSPEQKALIQEIINSIHQRFMGLVAQARHRPLAEIRPLADGRIFTASAALDAGLVDELGYWREAVAGMAVLLKEPEVKVLRYEEHFSWTSFLRATAEWPQELKATLRPAQSFRLQFLFSP